MLPAVAPSLAPSSEVRSLYRLTDPALSELGFDELLDELLVRIRQLMRVDTVAILLLDKETNQLVARAAKGIEEEVERGVRLPVGQGFAGRIAAERVPIFIADVDHADILNPILREKGIRSLLGVPLIVEGDLIGVLHVGSLRPRKFAEKDVAILQLAAARVGPGIERARLYSALEREHRVAMILQRSLLPRRLPEIVGTAVAARYLPARDEVGGDWYDLIELPRGLVGIVIGDVVGHGIKAATLMGQLRTVLRSYALEGHPPGRTLELVDRFVITAAESAMATAIYAVFDPESNRLHFATAGHLPPVLIAAQGARLVDVAPSPPLGAFPYGVCAEHQLVLGAGETLMLYTDGLVERRGIPLTQGLDALLEVVADATSPEEACLLSFEQMVPVSGPSDDAAVITLQNTPVPAELRLELPADPKVLSDIRRALRRWLRHHGADGEEIAEVTLAVNEACANAIEHAYSPAPAAFELDGRVEGNRVLISIRDGGRWREPRGANRGRGFTIMEAAMDHVEVKPGDDGTEVLMRRPRRR